MKKVLILVIAVAVLSLVSCNEGKKVDYKALGEKLAHQLDSLCELSDTAAILAFNDSLSIKEEEVFANGDSADVANFINALKESRMRVAPFITKVKVEKGVDKEKAMKELIYDALRGDVDISTVTATIDSLGAEQIEE